MKVSGWGNYPVIDSCQYWPRTEQEALASMEGADSVLGRGLGRSYGDASLNGQRMINCSKYRAMLQFDEESGLLVAEAGVSLEAILETFLPRGWFLPVTPGTKFVSLGGAVASDVHGKNHHVAGSFCNYVKWLDVFTPISGIVRCSATEEPDLFYATCGGSGLTGLILRVALYLVRVPSAYIAQTTIKAGNIFEIMDIFEGNEVTPFSVAWIDCLKSGSALGRSIFMGGRFATIEEVATKARNNSFSLKKKNQLTVPFNFPSFLLNSLSVKAFNALYYGKAKAGSNQSIVDYNSFFYPLDSIHHWNRIYGKRGFTQYQFVLPLEASRQALPQIMTKIAASGLGSFLAVLKLFGDQPSYKGNLSFPARGYTLALDFPISKTLFPVLNELDAIVIDCGGRHYLSKDIRLSRDAFQKGYVAELDTFKEIKNRFDPSALFTSLQSCRLGIA